jgi:hypothetical protein
MEKFFLRRRYFTATPPKSHCGRKGFHLDEKYKCLFSITNAELIRRGYINALQPIYVDVSRIVSKDVNGVPDLSDPYARSKIITEVFKDLQERTARDSKAKYDIAPRLLIKFPSSTHLSAFQNSKDRKDMGIQGIHTYTISCLHKLFKGDVKYDNDDMRNEYLKEQRDLPINEPSLTGYVQMLGEGVNVQGFNAFLSFESLFDEITRSQTFGRIRRPNSEDREFLRRSNFTHNELQIMRDSQKLNKPYGYVYILMWTIGSIDYRREVQTLMKRDFCELLDEIHNPILIEVSVSDELPTGNANPGTFLATTKNPPDKSNVSKIELSFAKEEFRLTNADMDEVKAVIQAEEEQSIIDIEALEAADAFEKELDILIGEI